ACCGTNAWAATTGSDSVFVNGKPAHRIGDDTRHCAALGCLIEGSHNVYVGGGKTGSTAKPRKTKELNLVGEFEWSPRVTEDELLTELAANRWSPNTNDFSAVPGGAVIVTPRFGNMLGAIIMQPVGSIKRINLFTHANPDLIGFSGHI